MEAFLSGFGLLNLIIQSVGFFLSDFMSDLQYKIWEDDYNAKDIFSSDFLQQKMDYIHQNPCQPHWILSQSPEDYIWSSARFYFTEEPCIIPIDDVREILV
jgi:hypothetical protein